MTPMPMDLMIELREVFASRFDNEGLSDFALELGIDYENLAGATRKAKARELALYLWRHSMLPKLAEVGPQSRADIDWATLLNPHVAPATPAPELPARGPKVDFRDLQKLTPILAAHAMFQTPDSRGALLAITDLSPYVHLDLNGNAHYVATSLLTKLNEFGEIGPDDTAIGRLLAYIAADPALPPADKSVIVAIAARNAIKIE